MDDRIVYYRNAGGKWMAAVNNRYKLIVGAKWYKEGPTLFDLEKDPDELINYYKDPAYAEIAAKFTSEIKVLMARYKEPKMSSMLV